MAIKAKVTPNKNILVSKVGSTDNLRVTRAGIDPSKIRLTDLFDVEARNALDGSVIIYNEDLETWQAKDEMDNQNTKINGGNF